MAFFEESDPFRSGPYPFGVIEITILTIFYPDTGRNGYVKGSIRNVLILTSLVSLVN